VLNIRNVLYKRIYIPKQIFKVWYVPDDAQRLVIINELSEYFKFGVVITVVWKT